MVRKAESKAYKELNIDETQANTDRVREVVRINQEKSTDLGKAVHSGLSYLEGNLLRAMGEPEAAKELFIQSNRLRDAMAIWDDDKKRLERIINAIDDADNSGNSVAYYTNIAKQWQQELVRDDQLGRNFA